MAPSLEDRIQQLKAFEAENGHLIVTVACKNDGLGSWVNNTRAKKAKGKLKPEMVDELDKLGFVWAIPKGPAKEELIEWGKQYRWLVNFHKNKGHCNVPAKIAGKDCACATWCDEQRRLYNDGQLDQGREKKLEILGFDFYGSSEDEPAPKRQRTDNGEEIEDLRNEMQALKEENKKLKLENDMLKKDG